MCARYTLTLKQARLVIAGLVHIFAFAPRYNIGPAQRVPVILNTAEGVKAMEMRWGIPSAWSKTLHINAQAENIYDSGLEALRHEDLRKVLTELAKNLSSRSDHVEAAARSESTIPRYNGRFVGRLEELELLRNRLHQGRTGVIGELPMIQQNGAGVVFCWHFCWHSRLEEIQILATLAVGFGGEGRNRTQTLYRSEPNTLCFKG